MTKPLESRTLLVARTVIALIILSGAPRPATAGTPVKSRAEAKAACVSGCAETVKKNGQLTAEQQRTYCDENCGCLTDALVSPEGKQSKHTRAELESLVKSCSQRALDKISKPARR
jgi:hypothetical protein